MPTITVCHRHQRLVPVGEKCPECVDLRKARDRARHAESNLRNRRNTSHWRLFSARARRLAGGVCPECGTIERMDDPGSKLSADLIGGGDHSKARLSDVRVACLRCHGRRDG